MDRVPPRRRHAGHVPGDHDQPRACSIRTCSTLAAVVFGGAVPIAYLAYPIAVAHQASKYSYKGWIAWELLLLFGRNAAATIYTNIVAILITIIPLGGAMALFFASPKFAVLDRDAPVGQYMFKLIDWAVSMAGNPETLEFYIKWPIYLFSWMFFDAAFRLIFAFVAAFSALYMVKVLDLFSYYNSSRLGLVPQMPINQPATFWVRYLAFWGDLCLVPLANFLVSAGQGGRDPGARPVRRRVLRELAVRPGRRQDVLRPGLDGLQLVAVLRCPGVERHPDDRGQGRLRPDRQHGEGQDHLAPAGDATVLRVALVRP